MAKIGVQMMMFRNIIGEVGVYETFKKLKDIGISGVEISQIPMTPENVAEMKRASEDLDIKIASLSAVTEAMFPGMETLKDDFDKIVNDCKTLNCNHLRIGMFPFSCLGSFEKSLAFAKECDEYAKRLAEHGIKLYFHTHHVEFVKYDGKYLLDIIRDNTELLGFELDVHWIQRGGLNPIEFIKDYKGRVELIHLKDYKVVEPNFEGVDLKDIAAFMNAFTNIIRFAELGDGSLDIHGIIKASLDSGAQYLFIEQDDTYGKDPFECVAASREYLVKSGFGDML